MDRSSHCLVATTALACLVALACGQPDMAQEGESQFPTAPVPTVAGTSEAVTSSSSPMATANSVARCEELANSRIEADPSAYRDTPLYIGNEQPVEEVRSWATGQPGYEELWIDRDHNGWVTVAFSQDAAARQADIDALFPGEGVVAVAVDWHLADLESLQQRVVEELDAEAIGSGIDVTRGVVTIDFGVLTDERVTLVADTFAGEPVCVNGRDPDEAPTPGPQPEAGDGWRLLAAERGAGEVYRTGVATDPESYRDLWAEAGVSSPAPTVDFDTEVVIWFGAVYGQTCPGLRLDDVVFGEDLVHAVIVLPDQPAACTADANPHAFVVAVARDHLPTGPLRIQLWPEVPAPGLAESTTIVAADLSEPGSTVSPEQLSQGTPGPRAQFVVSGDVIEPATPWSYALSTHCGIEWLGVFNDVVWRTDADMPAEWRSAPDGVEEVEVSLVLDLESRSITASANGANVVYTPTADDMPGCD